MDLAYTITAYPPSVGGAQLHTHLLLQQLKKRHDVQVASFWDSNRTDWLLGTTLRAQTSDRRYTIDGVPVHRLGLSRLERVRLAPHVAVYYPLMGIALPAIAQCIERHLSESFGPVDLIHNVRIGREPLSFASLHLARRRRVPFVLTPLHHPRWVGQRYRAFTRLYTMADLILALTQVEKETLVRLGVPEERIVVTGVGPVLAPQSDPERFRQQLSVAEPTILFIGQHYGYKGYRHLLEAAPHVWKQIPEAHFVFIGPSVGRSEEDFAKFADKRIHRLGRVSLQEKTDALAACAILCIPSTQESFGGVYTEAWSFGKPVIGCRIPAVAEVIADGKDGVLVEQEPREIAERIRYLLLHPGYSQALGAAGKQKVEQRFSWEKIAATTERAYQVVTRACRQLDRATASGVSDHPSSAPPLDQANAGIVSRLDCKRLHGTGGRPAEPSFPLAAFC